MEHSSKNLNRKIKAVWEPSELPDLKIDVDSKEFERILLEEHSQRGNSIDGNELLQTILLNEIEKQTKKNEKR